MPAPTALAFEELVALHQRDVLRVCRSILRDDHLGRDAAQETFLRLWERLETADPPLHLRAWLRRVALRAAIDVARRRRAWRGLGDESADELPEPAAETELPDELLSAAEIEERLRSAILELSEGQRTVFLLRHDGDLPLAEIAETLEISLSTARTHFARACLALQSKLAPFRPSAEESR